MITKDGRDTRIENVTPENYVVPQGEERVYHCVIEVPQFDPRTGRRLSRPRLQKFGIKAYESLIRDTLIKQGFTILVLHDPKKWMESEGAKAAAEKEAAEKARFDAAVEEAVAKALAAKEKKGKK